MTTVITRDTISVRKINVSRLRYLRRNRAYYMSAHVLLNSINELRKRDKMRDLSSILSLFLQRV